jgi:geranylgeranyl diphosphate synthase type II
MPDFNFEKYLSKKTIQINSALKKNLPKDKSLISQTMKYAVLTGGKRLRPLLVLEGARLFDFDENFVMDSACAVEFVHAYSLVHDDLPAMDNDDLRRGRPTVHKKFGEAPAILCGDALLTESFNLMVKSKSEPEKILKAVSILSHYCGYAGMIGGQVEDTLETGSWDKKNASFLSKKIKSIQLKKTGALLSASLQIGAVLAGAANRQLNALKEYGFNIGCAFQIIDDILDVYADKKLLGKKGSDIDNNKLTALSLLGKEGAFKDAVRHTEAAKKDLKIFGAKAGILIGLADFIISRGY